MEMAGSIAKGLLQATKAKLSEVVTLVTEELKAPPTPRGESGPGPGVGDPKAKLAMPPMPATTTATKATAGSKKGEKPIAQPPPKSSIQQSQPSETGARRRGYMDSKLGSTNKKAVTEDRKAALARKAGYL